MGGMSGGQINKNSDIVDWVAKLNALKEKEAALKGNMTEKEAKKEATGKKGDPKVIEKLRQDIEKELEDMEKLKPTDFYVDPDTLPTRHRPFGVMQLPDDKSLLARKSRKENAVSRLRKTLFFWRGHPGKPKG